MHITAEEFNHWPNKSITLLGMSGVGKTRLANLLRSHDWFHYSGDYRIGTRYLDEAILDNIKKRVMQVPFLCDLLRSDSIYIRNNITVNNLSPVSSFMGKLGNPEQDGLDLEEFKRRQRLHEAAEIASIKDVPEFIKKAQEIYGYQHFIHDAGGSLCELDDKDVLAVIAEHTLIIYIQASEGDEVELIRRAQLAPKPLYYREDFLDKHLQQYLQQNDLEYVASIDPDDFARTMFPKLFKARIPRYEGIADKYGYTITTAELAQVASEEDFMQLLQTALSR